MIKDIPLEENPREKAYHHGIETLSNVELLAILLRTGNKQESVMDLSTRLLNEIGGIRGLKYINYGKLTSLKGIKKAKALEILASMELSKRIAACPISEVNCNSAASIYNYMREEMINLKQEHFVILVLDNKYRLIKKKTLFIGSVNMSVVSAREVFMETLDVNGVALVCVHNHPSGDARPSGEDEECTKRLIECGKIMNIKVLDHIIIGLHQYYSFMAKKVFLSEGQ